MTFIFAIPFILLVFLASYELDCRMMQIKSPTDYFNEWATDVICNNFHKKYHVAFWDSFVNAEDVTCTQCGRQWFDIE